MTFVGELIDVNHFWSKVDRSDASGCHPFRGSSRGPNGHKAYSIGRWGMPDTIYRSAHSVALELMLGRPLRPNYVACHVCDNPPCCNPDHLFEGTVADNNRDSMRKGRNLRGRTRSDEFKRKAGDAHRRRQRYVCGDCDMVTEASGMSSHQYSTRHSGVMPISDGERNGA